MSSNFVLQDITNIPDRRR